MCFFQSFALTLKSYYFVDKVHTYANAHEWACTHKETDRQTDRVSERVRMKEQSHVYTQNYRSKGSPYLKALFTAWSYNQ